MNLYIAEKPSLGRAIADALPKPHKKHEGYIEVGNGDCVSWCIGHLLEQAEPDVYDEKFKSWKFEHLPIIPEKWQLKPKTQTRKQLTVLRKLVKQANRLINAGDPDREGQLLVDEVISYLGVSNTKTKNTQRLLISDLNQAAVKRALGKLRPNQEFVPLATSALARSRADWLFGMNMTRAYTIQGKKVGYNGVLSVGRVQTPLLGLVVRRDQEIENFQSKPFYEVSAHLITKDNEPFTAKWKPSEACAPYQDEEGRVLSKKLAENVVSRITGQPANVDKVTSKEKKQTPPLLYNLSSLQIDCSKRFAMSAQDVLTICQSLYEKHKLITYPRSDSRYLPKEQHKLAPRILSAISHGAPELIENMAAPNPVLKSKSWNDSKVDAHHAIVPTEKTPNPASLSGTEKQVYLQVARQYLAQFYPDYVFSETVVDVIIQNGLFIAKAKQDKSLGWKALFKSAKEEKPKDSERELQSRLPDLVKGQRLDCVKGELVEKQTQPPKAFTDATLLSAMTGISRYVKNPDIKKILKETDGLGTEATRAGIIELLFKRGFLRRQGKTITSTQAGRGLINSLPETATTPDMTALWESNLDAISRKEMRYQSFMAPMLENLESLIVQAGKQLPTALQGVSSSPVKKKRFNKRKKSPK